jgi:hypothetical protein
MKTIRYYTKELLDSILQEGNATLLETYNNYNQRMRIKFRCSCGAETEKKFEMLNLYKYPYCEACSLKKKEAKRVQTCIREHGVINTAQLPEVIKKINNTNLIKYGDHPKRTKEVQKKWKDTCLEKYGGHPNQNIDVQAKSEKSSFAYKDYMFPSGNVVKIQGYENLALDELVQKYDEEDIIIGRGAVPTITYYMDDVKHVYFPDFYIKSEHKIIEVKSEWTIQLHRANIEEKAAATIKTGYKYEIWIYNGKQKKLDTLVFPRIPASSQM